MTNRLYLRILIGLSTCCVLYVGSVAVLRILADQRPARPARLAETAIWRPTPSEEVQLSPHGDWIACWRATAHDHCVLTDAHGQVEFESDFDPVSQDPALKDQPLPDARLRPVVSDTITPWMWSTQANRLVPMIQMEDGSVLAPVGSGSDIRSYVKRMEDGNTQVARVPAYLEYHPAGSAIRDR